MRLCTPVSPCLMAAAALLTPVTLTTAAPPAPAHAGPHAPEFAPAHASPHAPELTPAHANPRAPEPAPTPACAAPGDRDFPLTTRLHGGPAAYQAGGGHGTWYLDLTNTTTRACSRIHPVVVLVDEHRSLQPSHLRLEFHDGTRFRPVRFVTTDAHELIGALAADDGGFPGFTIGPGRTRTVTVRLAVAPDAGPDEVTANAAIVQRREDDGDWVGQSNDYGFRVLPAGPSDSAPALTPGLTPAAPDGGFPFADQLAGTGLRRVLQALTTAALLVAAGTTAVLLARRRR
ncbi:hypothetical protein TU94_12440 [Streptomyces cyaneogriseus subsp. noncyanogenus]|uniref:Gram-positive cocci surface proteins LPxTG domain-containing protein n=1 Tax=Streptomyces cyaneogriseus subsp. noncyanogenus TaxID=477245 RepID=A0A0C5FWV1_9ACTN|nr:hypothetical protein [Streptomyces cyaneogriseus]AJP02173.1 hypothetical protein TU94_12440 [Streptomyces cyaneogriseus subsp. noncyanogenus]